MTNWQIANLKDRLDERCVDGEGINVTREDVETLLAEREALLKALKAINAHWTSGNFTRERSLWNPMLEAIAKAES